MKSMELGRKFVAGIGARVLMLGMLATLLQGCAQTTYWVKNGGTSAEFDRTQAACHNQAFFLPQVKAKQSEPSYMANTTLFSYTNTAYTTITPYQAPYQNMADAFGSLAASLENIARREKFLENCMVANGWKKIKESNAALTVSTYAIVGDSRVMYEGTATGYLNRTGIMKVISKTGDVCVGSFRYISSYEGTGVIRCDSGDSAEIKFSGLSNASGYGYGTTNRGKKVKFVYGIDGDEREKYLR